MQTFASRGYAPRRLFIEKRIGLRKEIPRRFGKPETEFIEQSESMVGAVSDEQDRLVEVRMEGGEHRQARRTRQAERMRGEVSQQIFVRGERADVGGEDG